MEEEIIQTTELITYELKWRRPDETYVILILSTMSPYHVDKIDALYNQVHTQAEILGDALPFEPPPEPAPEPIYEYLSVSTMWERMTDEEAELFDAAIHATTVPIRLRRFFDSAQNIHSTTADYNSILNICKASIGNERAIVVMKPTH